MTRAEYQKEWLASHPGYKKRWNAANREKVRAWQNTPRERARKAQYLKDHPSTTSKERYKRWYAKHGKTKRERLKLDPVYSLKKKLSGRIRQLVRRRGGKKSDKTVALLGCSIPSFRLYLESRFDVGMSWENYGKWEIDHIVPCALFDLTKPEHQRRCFHFSNLQPLWKPVNAAKGARLFHQPDFLRL